MTKTNATDPSQMQAEELLSFLEEGGTLKMLHDVSADTIEHIYAVGYNFFQSGKIEQAAKVFQLLSMLDHYQARFFIGLGAARQELGEYLQAIDAYSYAALVDINDPRPPFSLCGMSPEIGTTDGSREWVLQREGDVCR